MRLDALAESIGARLLGDGSLEVTRVRDAARAQTGDLTFAAAARERRAARATAASAILVDEEFAAEHAHELPCAVLASAHAADALVRAVELLHPIDAPPAGIDPRAAVRDGAVIATDAFVGAFAVVESGAVVQSRAQIHPHAYVGRGVHVGRGSVIGVGAVVLDGAHVGANTVVGPHAVVGDQGFVFAPRGAGNARLRHVGDVSIGDDVDIGAGTCVDRGALGATVIESGTRIDNLVQVGHDVHVGRDAVLVAQVGLAGHVVVGAGAVLAGQSGVQEHTHIGAGARVGGKAGVTRDVAAQSAVSGMPAIPHAQWLRAMVGVQHLAALERRVRSLEAELAARPQHRAHPGDKP